MPQVQIVLRNCGIIDPKDITTYRERDGFKALEKARSEMTPEDVINEIKLSGLRGRGGAGFPCGIKWEGARNSPGEEKYVICIAEAPSQRPMQLVNSKENRPSSVVLPGLIPISFSTASIIA